MSDPTARVATLPPPAPGFPALVRIHLYLLLRESRVGTLLLAALCLLLPVAALVSAGPEATEAVPHRILLLTATMMGLTIFLTFLWPESVWRKLGIGERLVLDAFPVSRRSHRMARVVAGAALPLGLLASLIVTVAILDARGWASQTFELSAVHLPGLHGAGILTTVAGLLAAYLLSSILALRFGKVFLGLLVLVGIVYLIPLLLVVLGFDQAVIRIGQWAMSSGWSPLPVLTQWYQRGSADLASNALWMAVFFGIALHFAGRHDGK